MFCPFLRHVRQTSSIVGCILAVTLIPFCKKGPGFSKSSFQSNKQTRLVLEEDLSIGSDSSKAEYFFSKIMPIRKDQSTIAVDEKERIYILDYEQCHIKIFDKNGAYIKTFGRNGQGPGEMESPLSISITNDDKVMVEDVRTRRLHFFSLDGDFQYTVSTAQGFRMLKFRPTSGGDITCLVVEDRPGGILYKLCLYDKKLSPLQILASYDFPVSTSTMHVFTPTLHFALYPNNRIVYGFPDVYELKIIEINGGEVGSIIHKYDPVEVTADEQEAIKKNYPPNSKINFPKYHNAFRYFTVDEDGRIFVQTWKTLKGTQNYYHDVYDKAGNYIAKIPLEIDPILWKKSSLYTVIENEAGIQIVKRYHVTWNEN